MVRAGIHHGVCRNPSWCVQESIMVCAGIHHGVCRNPSWCVQESIMVCAGIHHGVCRNPSWCVQESIMVRAGIHHGGRTALVHVTGALTDISSTCIGRKEGNVLFNVALNTFYLRLYGVRHIVKEHSVNPLSPHRLRFPISSKGYFICLFPTVRITHTTVFATPVVQHCLEREIAQYGSTVKDRSMSERSNISLPCESEEPTTQDSSATYAKHPLSYFS